MYVKASDVRVFSRISAADLGYGSDTEFEAHINELINHAEGVVENYCDVPDGFFEVAGATLTDEMHDHRKDSDGAPLPIYLLFTPVLSVTSVEVNTASEGSAASWSTLAASDYVLDKRNGMLKIVGTTKPGQPHQSIRVTYVAGYASTPQPVMYVVMSIVNNILHAMLQRKISPTVRVDDWTVRMVVPDVFTEELQAVLAPYARMRVSVG